MSQEALERRIAEVETAIETIERRKGRRSGAERAEIAERSRYLSGLKDAFTLAYGDGSFEVGVAK